VLISSDDSSLVVDTLCDQTSGQNTPVSCFYLDFTARKEQPASDVLGSMLKQMVGGMEKIPEEISRVFQQQRTTIGGRRPQLVNIVKMLLCVTSSRRIFMCLDALDECAGAERFKLLDSLTEILEQSPATRIFVTGRPYIRAEVNIVILRHSLRHCLLHCHTSVYNSVSGAKGGVAVKERRGSGEGKAGSR